MKLLMENIFPQMTLIRFGTGILLPEKSDGSDEKNSP
jgi:hypothetical protein